MQDVQHILNTLFEFGFTVSKIAEKTDVVSTTVYRWVSGETSPRLEQYGKLKELFETSMEDTGNKPYKEAQ